MFRDLNIYSILIASTIGRECNNKPSRKGIISQHIILPFTTK